MSPINNNFFSNSKKIRDSVFSLFPQVFKMRFPCRFKTVQTAGPLFSSENYQIPFCQLGKKGEQTKSKDQRNDPETD